MYGTETHNNYARGLDLELFITLEFARIISCRIPPTSSLRRAHEVKMSTPPKL